MGKERVGFFKQICIYHFVNYIKFIESFQCWVKKLVKKVVSERENVR